MSKVSFDWWKKHSFGVLLTGLGLCALLVITGNLLHIDAIATNTLGAYRWFNLGALGSFQPAEFLKFGVLLYFGTFLGLRARQGLLNNMEKTIIPLVVVALIALLFVVIIQKDMGTGIALGGIIASIVMVSGIKRGIVAKLALGVLILGVLSVAIAPHRVERIVTFLKGDDHSSNVSADDSSYHIRNAMIALGTGGFFGRGIGNSIQATGYLPEAINDSVFAIMGETFGFFGVCIILGIFTALLLRLLRIVDHLPDLTMRLVVAGVFGWLLSHVVLNVASMIGVIPLTGITLPLLSFGGTSMLFITGAMGLAFQLSKYTQHQSAITEEADRENLSGRRRIRRSRIASRRGY
jgi:cell division protein FtsW